MQTITIAFATPKHPKEELKVKYVYAELKEKGATEHLESSEWDRNNEGIEIIRRLASEHPEVLAEHL